MRLDSLGLVSDSIAIALSERPGNTNIKQAAFESAEGLVVAKESKKVYTSRDPFVMSRADYEATLVSVDTDVSDTVVEVTTVDGELSMIDTDTASS